MIFTRVSSYNPAFKIGCAIETAFGRGESAWGPALFFMLVAEGGKKIAKVRANGDIPHPEKSIRDGSPQTL